MRDWLVQTRRVGKEDVFMDVTAILPGADFMRVITDAICQCRAVIVVISPAWLAQITVPDPSYVRAEAEIALANRIPVIPVLVGGATMPAEQYLPEPLRPLTRLNIQPVRHETFDYDMGQVRKALHLGAGPRSGWVVPLAVVLVVALSLGVLTQVPPGRPLVPWPFPPRVDASVTATPPASYSAYNPGPNGCDPGQAEWTDINRTTSCVGGSGTTITKTLGPYGAIAERWGQVRFQPPGHSFPATYSISVTIDQISEPTGPEGCAGFAVHTSPDGNTADTVQICEPGTPGSQIPACVVSLSGGVVVNRVCLAVDRPSGDSFTVRAEVTASSVIWRVTGLQNPIAGQAVSSTTAFISLAMFWESAGAHARFTNFTFAAE
jgi:hypothetical protein